MTKPRLLDLFCGAGGASMGYHRAGFDVVGIDIESQPHYPFEFVQHDALTVLNDQGWWADPYTWRSLDEFDAIHASPPCQAYSVANNVWKKDHPRLIEVVREGLIASDACYVIENVPGAPLLSYAQVCGLSLGLNVKRHRWFESSELLMSTPCGNHAGDWLLVFGHTVLERGHVTRKTPAGNNTTHRKHTTTARGRAAMGIDWMNRDELSQAIPPAYCEYIGQQLMAAIKGVAA